MPKDSDASLSVSKREVVFNGKIWDVVSEGFDYNGTQLVREFVAHPGAVAIIAINDQQEVLLIKQYRHPVREYLWEIPAGLLDIPGEARLEAAKRELLEETGLRITESDLGDYLGSTDFRQDWVTGDHETGVAHFYALTAPYNFALDKAGWTKDEHRDVLDFRWFTIAEIEQQALRVGPPDLVEILRRAL